MTSCTISSMSCKSPSVRVIGSKEVLEAFDFFRGPTCSLRDWHFNCVDGVYGSMPPSSTSDSSSGEGDVWSSRSFSLKCFYSVAAFCCFVVAFTASYTSCDFAAAASFLLFYDNCTTHSFSSSFFLCVSNFYVSNAKMARACHSSSHDSSIVNMTSSMASYGSSFHFFARSFDALI